MSKLSESLAKAQETKSSQSLTRAEIINFTKAIRDCVRLDSAVEIAILLVKKAER